MTPTLSDDASVAVFAALGDPTRQRLLTAVARGDGSAGELAELLAVTRQAVEKQLRVLERAGLVERVRLGRRVSFAVRTQALAESASWLCDLADAWDRRLSAVKVLAESPPPES